MLKNFIAIDGGGTKTEFALFNERGQVFTSFKLGGTNPNGIGSAKSNEIIAQGINKILEICPDIYAIFAGISGLSIGDNDKILVDYLTSTYKNIKIAADSDLYNVLQSSPTSANIACICGTGSVVFVKKDDGTFQYVGGYGHLFDTSGSAYHMGRDAISAALYEQDGSSKFTKITPLLQEILGNDVRDSLDQIYQKGKDYIASFARIVFAAYAQGDEVAAKILQQNAKYLANLIATAVDVHGGGRKVILQGGIFENCSDTFLPLITQHLPDDVEFILPNLPPIYGACVECLKRFEIALNKDFYENFKNSYN